MVGTYNRYCLLSVGRIGSASSLLRMKMFVEVKTKPKHQRRAHRRFHRGWMSQNFSAFQANGKKCLLTSPFIERGNRKSEVLVRQMSGNPTYQAGGITSGLPVIRPESETSRSGS